VEERVVDAELGREDVHGFRSGPSGPGGEGADRATRAIIRSPYAPICVAV
jgi:hypothetical protein